MLDKGEIAERGTHEELLARGGIYAALWSRQRQVDAARGDCCGAPARPNDELERSPPAPRPELEPRLVTSRRLAPRVRAVCPRAPVHVASSNPIRRQIAPIHPEGYMFMRGFAVATLVLCVAMGAARLARPHRHAVVRLFLPRSARVTPLRADLVVAPADGVVSFAGFAAPPPELGLGGRPMQRVSIFMSVFDCHVNRAPVAGPGRAHRL